MGVTRISLGVQDLEPAVQRAIGRMQSYEETEACAKAARALGVHSLNLDLIYGLPLQTEEGVARTARRALALKADRVAVFGYAHVPWMKKHQALIPEEQLPGPTERYAQLNAIHRVLTEDGGYVAIGLDHYALKDRRDGEGGRGAKTEARVSRATPPTPRRSSSASARVRSARCRKAMSRTRRPRPAYETRDSKRGGSRPCAASR